MSPISGQVNDTFSMSMWVYPEEGYTPDDDHLIDHGQMLLGNDEQGYNKAYPSLYIKNDALIVRFGHADGNGYCRGDSRVTLFTPDNWQYVTVVFDGSQFKFYKNGKRSTAPLAPTVRATTLSREEFLHRQRSQPGDLL